MISAVLAALLALGYLDVAVMENRHVGNVMGALALR